MLKKYKQSAETKKGLYVVCRIQRKSSYCALGERGLAACRGESTRSLERVLVCFVRYFSSGLRLSHRLNTALLQLSAEVNLGSVCTAVLSGRDPAIGGFNV